MTFPQPNTAEAVDFLVRYRGSDSVLVTAIVPDGSSENRIFRPLEQKNLLRRWLDARQGRRNLYFAVNPTLIPSSDARKPREEYVRGVTTLHVDIDPDPDKDFQRARERIFAELRAFAPPPSFILDSGGGYQGFWLLDREYPIRDENDAARLEVFNREITARLRGDQCHNIERIMRLPGTIDGC